jgi:hypothetical protein
MACIGTKIESVTLQFFTVGQHAFPIFDAMKSNSVWTCALNRIVVEGEVALGKNRGLTGSVDFLLLVSFREAVLVDWRN